MVQQPPAPSSSGSSELQITPRPAPRLVPSASGGTIHHLGRSPLANPLQQQQPMSNPQQQAALSPGPVQQPLRRLSSSSSSSSSRPPQSPDRPPRKKLRLEQRPAANEEVAHYRRLICEEKLREMGRIRGTYEEHLKELFFLQNGGNLMDYFVWLKKPPSAHLQSMLKSARLDSDDDEDAWGEVAAVLPGGSPKPSVTPVAISTTLPPAVSAIKQEHGESTISLSRMWLR